MCIFVLFCRRLYAMKHVQKGVMKSELAVIVKKNLNVICVFIKQFIIFVKHF